MSHDPVNEAQARHPYLGQLPHAGEGIATHAVPPVLKLKPKEEPPTRSMGPGLPTPSRNPELSSMPSTMAPGLLASKGSGFTTVSPSQGEGGGSSQLTRMAGDGRAFCRNNGFIFSHQSHFLLLLSLQGGDLRVPESQSPGPRSDLPSVCVPLLPGGL